LLFYSCTESSSTEVVELFCESRTLFPVAFGGSHKAIRSPYRAESLGSGLGIPWI